MSSWLLKIFLYVYQWLQKVSQVDFWNVISASKVFLLGWQVLVLFLRCSSFCSLHLLSATLIVIVYLQLSFWIYWIDLECILVVFFFVFFCFFFVFFVCVSSDWVFISFCSLTFVGFILSSKDAFFMLYHFSLIVITSQVTLHLVWLESTRLLFPYGR